jgi:hypothetical protein
VTAGVAEEPDGEIGGGEVGESVPFVQNRSSGPRPLPLGFDRKANGIGRGAEERGHDWVAAVYVNIVRILLSSSMHLFL